ncbi:AsmA-like C-terminal region-containing protein [Isosphaeraceae bacterium EP7]
MRIRSEKRRRIRRILTLALVLLSLGVGGVAWLAYAYLTDSDTWAATIRAQAPRFLPGSVVDVGRVQPGLFSGHVSLLNVNVTQAIDGSPFVAASIARLQIAHDARALLRGEFVPRRVDVSYPVLRLKRRKDGRWNLQGLLADPWPGPELENPPPVFIHNGKVELSDESGASAILRDVEVTVQPVDAQTVEFEGSAQGDTFERVRLHGRIDRSTGSVTLAGNLDRLVMSDILRGRLPADIRALVDRVGLTGGEADLMLRSASFKMDDPKGSMRYDAGVLLKAGVWNCPELPFPFSGVSASLSVADGKVVLDSAEGFNGETKVHASGECSLDDPKTAPMDFELLVNQLALDGRLKARTPPQFTKLWDEFKPSGKVSVALHAVRRDRGGPMGVGMTVECEDVAMTYHLFKYPLSGIRGRMTLENDTLKIIGLRTMVGGKPVTATGTIEKPGPLAVANLTFKAESLPIDDVLLKAMPPDVREVVQQFSPQGTVNGVARMKRVPPSKPGDPVAGVVTIDADLDLNERCSIRWAGLPYPVTNLTGHLEIHPDLWIIRDMKGNGGSGSSTIAGSGKVRKVGRVAGKDLLNIDLKIDAAELRFDNQLRDALPPAWKKTWAQLNPSGTSDVKSEIKIVPGQPDSYKLTLTPGPQAAVRLAYSRDPSPGDPGGHYQLQMDDVRGQFEAINGTVDMKNVDFNFYGSPVRFETGRVRVEDSGRFDLAVKQLKVQKLRLDSKLQEIMPPVMASFARRLDDGHPFTIQRGNLNLGWSGVPGAPVHCGWSDGLVVLDNNSADTGIPLHSLQGQLDSVAGLYDGTNLSVSAALNLDSVIIKGQQVTRLTAPIEVDKGVARIKSIRGTLLDGEVTGALEVNLEATPRYKAEYQIREAKLQSYARTVAGSQAYRGTVSGRASLEGQGSDMRTVVGDAEVYINEANLGEMPDIVRLLALLQPRLRDRGKAGFNAAEVHVRVRDGVARLNQIRLTGNPLNLQGNGTLDMQGNLDLSLVPGFGDGLGVKFVNNSLRAASSQLFGVKVGGTLSDPRPKLVPFPVADEAFRLFSQRHPERASTRR